MKHSLLLSKVQKSQAKTKRRRPNKKLVANLESLADALPDADANDGEGAGAGIESGDKVVGQATIRQKSLKSRPGALKRREKVEKEERERFGKNMAQLAGGAVRGSAEGGGQETRGRWEALRGFIGATLERKKEFGEG